MRKLIFATNNSHKLCEVRELLSGKFEVFSPYEVGFDQQVEESATTLEGNALLKARALKEATGLDCFADDTGLEVEALGGEPGVRSARYATTNHWAAAGGQALTHKSQLAGHDAEANNDLLLKNLQAKASRKARFRTVIALILSGEEHLFEGVVEGEITAERRGEEGFGYDPIFIPEGGERTFAQMCREEKGSISHRGRAMAKLVGFLENL